MEQPRDDFEKRFIQVERDLKLQQAQHKENIEHMMTMSQRLSGAEIAVGRLEQHLAKNQQLIEKGNEDNERIIYFLENAKFGVQIIVGSAKFIRWLAAVIIAGALILTSWNAIRSGKLPLID